MDSPEFWRWVWVAVAAVGALGEMASAGSFFLLPFALGGVVAAVLAFAGVPIAIEWVAFVGVTVAAVVATRPLARRLDIESTSDGIGARRWIGQSATVIDAIPPGPQATGLVRLGREQWRAESLEGLAIDADTVVKVVDLAGTRLVVWPLDQIAPRPPEAGSGPPGSTRAERNP